MHNTREEEMLMGTYRDEADALMTDDYPETDWFGNGEEWGDALYDEVGGPGSPHAVTVDAWWTPSPAIDF
jgi:hypothetical protein